MSVIAKARIFVVLAAVVLFYAINSKHPTPKDPRQVEFERWLAPIESAPSPLQAKLQEDPIHVALSSDYPEFQADWKLSTTGGPADAHVMRILQLAREGNLFSLGLGVPADASPAIRLNIEREKQKFALLFTREDVTKNLQAQSVLKLFEVYAGEQESPAALSQP